MDWFNLFYAAFYGVGIPVGLVMLARRAMRQGDTMNKPDGKRVTPREGSLVRPDFISRDVMSAAGEAAATSQHLKGPVYRVRVAHPTMATLLGVRVVPRRKGAGGGSIHGGFEARFLAETPRAQRARALWSNPAVYAALEELCRCQLPFSAVDLYLDSDLVVDFKRGKPEQQLDAMERVLRLAEAMESAVHDVANVEAEDELDGMSAAGSASGSPVSFPIDVRR